ncbi:D-glycero-beta-D-manno-heptose 1-phosphate adenylyltransferase [Stratiformator vulcanicus]|uniref:Bifunctional protein HldE n=1 Tax=Stratiformator vulcanicus TaxID=2527980 RepID=A0A517QWW9_9PLAN|nr:D-glycero-beta-D-manno-heptose 1-phosphate adenylyltransferase [Stratiformator vulcanicus]QDT36166.1 Bifunctional protein HldE [Stratiformator vulcanicus]
MTRDLISLIEGIGSPRILVVGDVILDQYVWGDAERISQEAPVLLLREESRESRLGGAANVAHMLRGLDAHVTLAGIVGADEEGNSVRTELDRLNVDHAPLIGDSGRPTTVKQRFLGRAQQRHPHQILRVDRESRENASQKISDQIVRSINSYLSQVDLVLISDYGKGVCTPRIVRTIIEQCRKRSLPVIVDPSSSGRCDDFRDATALTPNRLETSRAAGTPIRSAEDAFAAGRTLVAGLGLDYIFVTLDSDGIAVVTADGAAELHPTRRRKVYDITGAGDMVLATIGLAAAAGLGPHDLARLANVAGGLEVEQVGCVPVGREEIIEDVRRANSRTGGGYVAESLDELCSLIEQDRSHGKRVVFTNGCFDLMHAGHVSYLEEAAAKGDRLVVGLNSDASVRSLGKGADRPLVEQQQRARMLAALKSVDYVVLFDESTPHSLIEAIRPDVLVKGGTYRPDEIVGREIVDAYGGEVCPLGLVPGLSTTALVEKIRNTPSSTDTGSNEAPSERRAA